MWPLERPKSVVRVGRDRVELWRAGPRGLSMHRQSALQYSEAPKLAALTAAISVLLADETLQAARLDLVVESVWLPVVLLEVGATLWSLKQADALMRHRVGHLYAERREPMSAWDMQLDYRPGDARGLGYALAPSVKAALVSAAAATGCRWASLQPAFAWSWRQGLAQRRWPRGWWLWAEQDRWLIALVQQGRVTQLNAGAAPALDAAEVLHRVEVEALRGGIDAPDLPVVAGGWQPLRSPGGPGQTDNRVSWFDVAGDASGHAQPAQSVARVEDGG